MVLSVLPGFGGHIVPESVREVFRYRQHRDAMSPGSGLLTEYERWASTKNLCMRWSALGRALKLCCQPDESLVRNAIGAVGYYSGLHIYDRAGLVSQGVARRSVTAEASSAGHDKVVPISFFEEQRPTYAYATLSDLSPRLRHRLALIEPIKVGRVEGQPFPNGAFPGVHFRHLETPDDRGLLDKYHPIAIQLPESAGFDEGEYLVLGRRKAP